MTPAVSTIVTPAVTPAIDIDQLSHAYQNGEIHSHILSDVTMQVAVGETVALIGRSGSGKSTLLNLISGLEPVESGNVTLQGTSMKALNDHHRTLLRGRHIGFIYQAFNLIPTLSVSDNIALPLALAGVSPRQQAPRIRELLSAIGLEGRDNDYPDRLSGGEQQRVAIGRALVHKPSLILADEPTGNLDAGSGRQVMQLLTDLVAEQRSAMLLVTHSKEVARSADRVLILDQGRIREMHGDLLSDSAAW